MNGQTWTWTWTGRKEISLRHNAGPGDGQHGGDWSDPDADQADFTWPFGQNLRHALGNGF